MEAIKVYRSKECELLTIKIWGVGLGGLTNEELVIIKNDPYLKEQLGKKIRYEEQIEIQIKIEKYIDQLRENPNNIEGIPLELLKYIQLQVGIGSKEHPHTR